MLAGYALDAWFGSPRRLNPVAGYGRLAAALERRMWADDRRSGARYVAVAVGVPVVAAAVAAGLTRRRPLARAASTAVVTWTVLDGRSLRRDAERTADALDATRSGSSTLDSGAVVRAQIDSVATQTSDAEVAPLVWGALAGLPGLVGYRAVSTIDTMVGNRTARYRQFGMAAARLDGLAGLVPSRLSAGLVVAVAPVVSAEPGSDPGPARWRVGSGAARAWLRYSMRHPGRNSGQVAAAMGGALRLGEAGGGRAAEHPSTEDIRRAVRLSRAVGITAAALCVGHVAFRPWRQRRRSR